VGTHAVAFEDRIMNPFSWWTKNWRSGWRDVRNHYGTTWWNREPLVWVWTWAFIGCAALMVAVTFPNMRWFVRWPGTHPNVFLLGVATFSLVTAPGLLGLLVVIFTPSRVASWLARHFTLAIIIYATFLLIYATFLLGLQGTGVSLSGRR
jgi:hypothetical protein